MTSTQEFEAPALALSDLKTKGILLRCARTYFHTRNWDRAQREYESINEKFPGDPLVLEQLGLVLMKKEMTYEGMRILKKAVEMHEQRGNPEKALQINEIIENGRKS